MKCDFCSGDLTIEDAKCPHCDADNPYYKAHRKDMTEYADKYFATKKKVEDRTERFTRKSLFITVFAVLITLNLVAILLLVNVDSINYDRMIKQNTKDADKFAAMISQMEADGNYIGINALGANYYLRSRGTALDEYQEIINASSTYNYFYDVILDIAHYKRLYTNASDLAGRLSEHLDTLYKIRYVNSANKPDNPQYAERHLDALDDMLENCKVLLIVYCGLSKEEADSLSDLTSAQRQVLIEQHLMELLSSEN